MPERHHNLPEGVPAELEWLFTEPQPGRLITYSFRCPKGAQIHRLHSTMPEVKAYTAALREYLEDGCRAPRTSKLGAKRVLTRKNEMVVALTKHYGGHALGSKGQLRQRIARLEAWLKEYGAEMP